jgi:hypothetical protein
MIPKRAIFKLSGLTLIPVVSIGFLLSEYCGVWDRYYGLHHVLKAAERLETSYAPDGQRVVEPHDPEWEPMLDLIQRYSLTHLPADREPKFLARFQARVVLENNNEHLKQRSAEGLPLFPALLSSRQEVVLVSCLWVGPGAPGSAGVQSVRPSAW